MAPKTKTTKEKVFHPASRKAGQLARKALRKDRLLNLTSKRSKKRDARVNIYGFFFHALPEEGVLTLGELHALVHDLWLTRNDEELEQERATRRKGRPKSLRETTLEDLKLVESEQYRTGIEILDLTHSANVSLFRSWDQKELAYVEQLRFIRISSQRPDDVVLSKPGKHRSLTSHEGKGMQVDDIL